MDGFNEHDIRRASRRIARRRTVWGYALLFLGAVMAAGYYAFHGGWR